MEKGAKHLPMSAIFVQPCSFLNKTKNCQILLAACFEMFPRHGNFCFVENLNTSPMKISDLDKSEKL